MPEHPVRYYVALVADDNSADNRIQSFGLSPIEAVESAWHNAGYGDEERPRMENEQDENGCEEHVVYGPRDQEIGRYTDVDVAWDHYDRIGYRAWECTERLYDALENTLEVDWERKELILDLPEDKHEAVPPRMILCITGHSRTCNCDGLSH